MEKINQTNQEKEVRVRYAPSPTGRQHIGGIRTALFNYLMARANKGKFILRLEDTDRTRYKEEYVTNLFESLNWLGLDWDEGGEKGGKFAPYVQSERFELYREAAHKLVESGNAYYCFCDAERLERIRKIQSENKMAPGYDRNCRSLTEEEIKEKLKKNTPYVIRLKVPLQGKTVFHDLLLGEIEWQNKDISPDPVLLKSDGFPTYHLANIIDDHLMQVSHVLRAQEWLPSTPLHVLLYKAFGWEPPTFCHLPMVNGQDGKKLSKRHGSTSLDEFRVKGYLPEAIINYVALLGCSYIEGKDLYILKELEESFDIKHLNKAPAVFDYKKLEWYNGQYIRKLTDEELLKRTLPFITGKGDAAISLPSSSSTPNNDAPIATGSTVSGVAEDENGRLYCLNNDMSDKEIRDILLHLMPLIKERLRYLSEAAAMVRFIFVEPHGITLDEITPKRLSPLETKKILLKSLDFISLVFRLSHDEAETEARKMAESLEVKFGDFMMVIRGAVTGSKVSPPLIPSIKVLGEKRAISRVKRVLGE